MTTTLRKRKQRREAAAAAGKQVRPYVLKRPRPKTPKQPKTKKQLKERLELLEKEHAELQARCADLRDDGAKISALQAGNQQLRELGFRAQAQADSYKQAYEHLDQKYQECVDTLITKEKGKH